MLILPFMTIECWTSDLNILEIRSNIPFVLSSGWCDWISGMEDLTIVTRLLNACSKLVPSFADISSRGISNESAYVFYLKNQVLFIFIDKFFLLLLSHNRQPYWLLNHIYYQQSFYSPLDLSHYRFLAIVSNYQTIATDTFDQ